MPVIQGFVANAALLFFAFISAGEPMIKVNKKKRLEMGDGMRYHCGRWHDLLFSLGEGWKKTEWNGIQWQNEFLLMVESSKGLENAQAENEPYIENICVNFFVIQPKMKWQGNLWVCRSHVSHRQEKVDKKQESQQTYVIHKRQMVQHCLWAMSLLHLWHTQQWSSFYSALSHFICLMYRYTTPPHFYSNKSIFKYVQWI